MSQCCSSVVEAVPALNHQWVSDSCLLSHYRGWPAGWPCLRTPNGGSCWLGIAANTRHWSDVGLIRAHRLRLWPNVRLMRLNVSCLLLGVWCWSSVTLYWPIINHYYVHIVHRRNDLLHHITWWCIASWSNPAKFTSILCIYKAFKNILMIVFRLFMSK